MNSVSLIMNAKGNVFCGKKNVEYSNNGAAYVFSICTTGDMLLALHRFICCLSAGLPFFFFFQEYRFFGL